MALPVLPLAAAYSGSVVARDVALRDDLQAIADAVAKRNNCSVSLAARIGAQSLAVASGFVALDGVTRAKTSDRYAWGSVTKTVTGSAILQLAADGKLSLDDKAFKYVDPMLKAANYPYPTMDALFQVDHWGVAPGVQFNATNVTIRHLLSMTSGVPDYDTDACAPRGSNRRLQRERLIAQRERLIARLRPAASRPPLTVRAPVRGLLSARHPGLCARAAHV